MANIFRNVSIRFAEKTGDIRKKFDHEVIVYLDYDPQGISVKIKKDATPISYNDLLEFPIQRSTETCRAGSQTYVINLDYETLFLRFKDEIDARNFHNNVMRVKNGKGSSVFSDRTEDSSAMQYFQFYGYLAQQQNMLQDYVRTSTYQKAILANLPDFKDKVILDVGAGSGILSFFAIQAGAKKVYAVEASTMAQHAETLVQSNNLQGKIIVIAGKIEEISIPEKVDVIISEPMGYMLYNERMLETYLHAKKWLDPKGRMYPSRGDLHIAPFSDENLYMEQYNKANFWYQQYFHGVDLSSLRNEAMKEYFRQPVVDTFDMRVCLAKSVQHSVNFLEADESDLHKIEVPLKFEVIESGTVHGLAFWFDVAFIGSVQTVWLSTSPTEPLTHWYQVRCLLERPLLAKVGQLLTGRLLLVANQRQSYDVTIELGIQGTLTRSSNTLDLKNPYFRYTGQTVQSPPGVNYTSPSENYWEQMDAQQQVAVAAAAVASRSGGGLAMVNGLASAGGNATGTGGNTAVNGFTDMQMDSVHTPPQSNQNILGIGNQPPQQQQQQPQQQPNIHPGSITSTGRQRVFTATSTQQAQLIGGGISPTLFTSTLNRDNAVSHNVGIGPLIRVNSCFGNIPNFMKEQEYQMER